MSKIHKKSILKGFSLVELLVVFSLMIVLSTMAFVGMRGYTTRQTLVQTTENLVTTLKLARSRAQTQVKPTDCDRLRGYRIRFTCNSVTCSSYRMVAVCQVEIPTTTQGTIPRDVTLTRGAPILTFQTVSGTVSEITSETTLLLRVGEGVPEVIHIYNDGRIESGDE